MAPLLGEELHALQTSLLGGVHGQVLLLVALDVPGGDPEGVHVGGARVTAAPPTISRPAQTNLPDACPPHPPCP
eukprot:2191573-Prorocentrum_lima.AAC.1